MADGRRTELYKDLLGLKVANLRNRSRGSRGGGDVLIDTSKEKEEKIKRIFLGREARREARPRRKDKTSGGNALQILSE